MGSIGGMDRALRIAGVVLLSLFYFLPDYWKLFGLTALPILERQMKIPQQK